MADKIEMTREGAAQLLNSLQDMQVRMNAKNAACANVDYEAEIRREDYGLTVEHPICTNAITKAYMFLDMLRSPCGTRFVQECRASVHGPSGHIVDRYVGHYLDGSGAKVGTTIYIDSYCSKNYATPMRGWSLVDGAGKTVLKNELGKKTGCLVPFAFILGAAVLVASICV